MIDYQRESPRCPVCNRVMRGWRRTAAESLRDHHYRTILGSGTICSRCSRDKDLRAPAEPEPTK